MAQKPSNGIARVTTSRGRLRGTHADGVDRFLGIPYAQSPTGDRRFAPPFPLEPWVEEREATRFGPTAAQNPYSGSTAQLLSVPVIPGDEVLTLNVWAPADAANAPVALWIHGGALERGASAEPMYDGATFAREGIVFVSANYRLGPEGFSVLDGAPLNLGLQDAAAALRWVHEEIAAFGGDPGRITIMGESAGGALVAALLTQPASRALVRGAIIESGPLDAVPPKKARRASDAIARMLHMPATREAFASVPPEGLLRARSRAAKDSTPLNGAPGFALALDEASLPAVPAKALETVDVPIVIGTNTDEYRLWLSPSALAQIGAVKSWLARRAMHIPESAYRAARAAFPDASEGELLGQLITDKVLRGPATRLARRRSAPTYLYEFAWPSPVRSLGAAHALEIGFVFDSLRSDEARRLVGPDAPLALARDMHASWVSFIRDGEPAWPRFDRARTTRVWDEHTIDRPQRRTGIVDAFD